MNRLLVFLLSALLMAAGGSRAATTEEQLNEEAGQIDFLAQSRGESNVTNKISSSFETFAGSRENARSLVTGLRSGNKITLTAEGQESVSFEPPTKPMGYGNTTITLALARQQLAAQGVTDPTPAELETALMGGELRVGDRTVAMEGVLQMRASGMGWGQIAQANGVKLGSVMSGVKAQRSAMGVNSPATTSAAGSASPPTRASKTYPGRGIVTAAGTSPAAARGNAKPVNAGNAGNATASHATSAAGHGNNGAPKGKAVGRN